MPTYEIGLDDGRKIHIDADDQDAALAGAQHFLRQAPSTTTGPAKSGGPLMFDDLPKGPPANSGGPLMFDDLPAGGAAPVNNLSTLSDEELRALHLQSLSDQDLKALYQTSIGPKVPSDWGDTALVAEGLAKAAGAGALSGTVGIPGDVMSLINLARRGYGALAGNGYEPARDDYTLGQGYENVRKAADNVYTPKNSAEDWAKTIGEFAPAVAAGPESLMADGVVGAAKVLAKRAVTQAALPAGAGAAATYATKGTPLEPYAGPAAALLTGGLTVRGKAPEVAVDAAKDATDTSYAAVGCGTDN